MSGGSRQNQAGESFSIWFLKWDRVDRRKQEDFQSKFLCKDTVGHAVRGIFFEERSIWLERGVLSAPS